MTLGSAAKTQLGIALLTASGLALAIMSEGYTPFVLALVALTTTSPPSPSPGGVFLIPKSMRILLPGRRGPYAALTAMMWGS